MKKVFDYREWRCGKKVDHKPLAHLVEREHQQSQQNPIDTPHGVNYTHYLL